MTTTNPPVPVRREMPFRAARLQGTTSQGATSATPTRPPGCRVTRSSAAATASLAPASDDPGSDASTSLTHYFKLSKRSAPSRDAVGPSRQSKRQRPDSGHYNEPSTDNEDDEDEAFTLPAPIIGGADEAVPPPITPTRAKRACCSMKETGGGGKKRMTKHSPSNKCNDVISSIETTGEPGIIPPWNTLPFYILLEILQLAAGTPLTSDSAKWLLSTSLVCRGFAEPALTALYRQPPLLTPAMAHGFVELLIKPPEETLFNYRQKIRVLSIDVPNVVAKKFHRQLLDLKTLILNTPQLSEVDLTHPLDNPANHELTKNLRWRYPAEMLAALGYQPAGGEQACSSPCELKTWTWNSRMMGDLTLGTLSHVHGIPSFNRLSKLTFLNFQVPSLDAADPDDPEALQKDAKVITALAKAVSVLPGLKHLVLESSTAVTGALLRLLPKSIQHLEINNCWDLTAADFTEYLLSHGYRLRHLTLYHNQGLSLEFLPELGNACPLLQSLDMDLTYYALNRNSNDTKPSYDTLVTAEQVPTWPSSLKYLRIMPLRQIDEYAAEMFFQSLVAHAATLPMLRHLEIKMLLNIPIRERCHMRDKWEAKLKEVFLRPSTDPEPVQSLRTSPIAETELVTQIRTPGRKSKQTKLSANDWSPPPRRSSRVATQPSDGSSRANSVGRDVRAGSRPCYAEPDTDEDIVSDDADSDEEDKPKEMSQLARELSIFSDAGPEATFIQGMCDVVDIQMDNQKLRETQWTADDFLDSEPDDLTEDEWDGDDGEEDGLAW